MEKNMKNELELGFVSRVYSDKDCTLNNRSRIPNIIYKVFSFTPTSHPLS